MNVENIDFGATEYNGGQVISSSYFPIWLSKNPDGVTELRIHNFGDLRGFPADDRGNVILVKE